MSGLVKTLSDIQASSRVDTAWDRISADFVDAYKKIPRQYMERTELSFHPYVKLLGYLCLEIDQLPGDVVEIGVWKGKSLAFMRALTSLPAKVIGVDPCALPGQPEELDYFHQQLFPTCSLIKKKSELAIQDVTNLSRSFKLLHIDGGHEAENVFMDFLIYEHFVVPGGYIVFDDYGDHAYSPAVGPAVDDLRQKGLFKHYEMLGQLPGYENSFVLKKHETPKILRKIRALRFGDKARNSGI
jgi:cephalosporin hydroxylase